MNDNIEKEILGILTETKIEGMDKFLKFLASKKSGFFGATTSAHFPGTKPQNLARHSLEVYKRLLDMLGREEARKPEGQRSNNADADALIEKCKLAALLHDLGDIPVTVNYGHAEKAIHILESYIKLDKDVKEAIRYHRGYVGDSEEVSCAGKAFESNVLARYLYLIDMQVSYEPMLVEPEQ